MKTGSKFRSDVEIADSILQNSKFLDSNEIEENAIRLVNFCRENKSKRTRLDAFMEEYGLSNNEGIALMCLAESLLRIPDKKTRDDLIKEKYTGIRPAPGYPACPDHLEKKTILFSKIKLSLIHI